MIDVACSEEPSIHEHDSYTQACFSSCRTFWYAAAIALQAMILVVLILLKSPSFSQGTELTIKATKGNSYSEQFRGNYVSLNYTIENLPDSMTSGLRPGEAVYAVLQRDGDLLKPRLVLSSKPSELQSDEVCIAMTVNRSGGVTSRTTLTCNLKPFFVSERIAKIFSKPINLANAQIFLDGSGRPIVKQIQFAQ